MSGGEYRPECTKNESEKPKSVLGSKGEEGDEEDDRGLDFLLFWGEWGAGV